MIHLVLTNSLWIVGLALLLAAFSYHYNEAVVHERPLREQLSRRSFRSAAWISAILVTTGLAATSASVWEAALWSLFTLFAAANSVVVLRERRRVDHE